MELRPVTRLILTGTWMFLGTIGSLVASFFALWWMATHEVRWAVVIFDVIVWLAIATMGSRVLYPRLTDDDLAAIRTMQAWFLGLAACALIMSHFPAVRDADRMDLLCLIVAGQAAIYVWLGVNVGLPRRRLPALQALLYVMGVWTYTITLFAT